MRGKSKRQRRMIASIVATVGLLMTSAAVVQFGAAKSWDHMLDAHKALRANWLAQPGTRAPLWGEVTEGSAFDHYNRAANVMRDGFPNKDELTALLDKTDQQLAEQVGDLRELWQPAVSALHEGAHASHVRLGTTSLINAPAITFLDHRWVSNAAAFETRLLRHAGEDLASVRMTLDAMSMGADVANQGLMIQQVMGIAMLTIAIDEWHDDALRRLDKTAKAEFATGLAKLEAQLPLHTQTDTELLFAIEHIRKSQQQSSWDIGGSWRYGFSARWMFADAILITARNNHRMDGIETNSWLERQRLSTTITKEVANSGNRAAAIMASNLLPFEKSVRHALGKVRLLRMALDHHRGVGGEPLADPFGNPDGNGAFLVAETEQSITFQSVGSAGHEPLEFVVKR